MCNLDVILKIPLPLLLQNKNLDEKKKYLYEFSVFHVLQKNWNTYA